MTTTNERRPVPHGAAPGDSLELVFAPDVEKVVLGTAIAVSSAAPKVIDGLELDDFADPRHRVVFAAVAAMVADGVEPSPVLVRDRLARDGQVRFVAGTPLGLLLHDLYSEGRLTASVRPYREALIRWAWRREADRFGRRLVTLAEDGSDEDLSATLDDAVRSLARLLARLAEVGR